MTNPNTYGVYSCLRQSGLRSHSVRHKSSRAGCKPWSGYSGSSGSGQSRPYGSDHTSHYLPSKYKKLRECPSVRLDIA